MIKLRHSEYYILLAIAISVLSLAFSIVSPRQKVGRYQFFVNDDSLCGYVYVIDTKTSRLFLRRTIGDRVELMRASRGGKTVCLDLGTVNKPTSTLENNTIVQAPRGFVPDEKR